MLRHRLTDDQWELIRDVFPSPAATGRKPLDRRKIVDGVLWLSRTGAPWRDGAVNFQSQHRSGEGFHWECDSRVDGVAVRSIGFRSWKFRGLSSL